LKFDGYRALAVKTGGRPRNDNDFGARYSPILKALATAPDETVIDGEVVALDPEGRPSFNLLQNYGSAGVPLHFFVFDILLLKIEDVMNEPLVKRRQLLAKRVLPQRSHPFRKGLRILRVGWTCAKGVTRLDNALFAIDAQ
jgi:bifunctional non-homologous end joining protein LigD